MAVATSPSTTESAALQAWETPSAASLTYLIAGTLALATGALLLLLVAAQSVSPNLLTVDNATTVGRLRPAAYLLVVYGGLGMLGAGVALDLARRIAKAPVQLEVVARVSGALTSLGAGGSALAVVLGHTTGRTGFEMPRFFAVVLALGQLLLAGVVLRTVAKRAGDDLHPSLWFVCAALVAAPIVLLAGALPSVGGVNDELVLAFGLSGLKLLWLVPLGIGIALYAVPAAARAPLHSRQLATVAFVGWFALAPFAGPARLILGPAPDWLETIGVGATIALLIPLLAVVVLLLASYTRRTSLVHAADLRFGLAGTGLLALYGVLAALAGSRTAGDFLHGTVFADGVAELALFGVAAAFLFAGALHCLGGVTGNRVANPRVASAAVWLLLLGVVVIALSLLVAGYVEGTLWAQGVRDGSATATGAGWVAVSDAIRPLLWLRVGGEALVATAFVLGFQQVFSTSTYGDPLDAGQGG